MPIKSLPLTTAYFSANALSRARIPALLPLGRHTIKVASDAQPGLVPVVNPFLRSSSKNHTLQRRTIHPSTDHKPLKPRRFDKEQSRLIR
jgi:hypothetical protein